MRADRLCHVGERVDLRLLNEKVRMFYSPDMTPEQRAGLDSTLAQYQDRSDMHMVFRHVMGNSSASGEAKFITVTGMNRFITHSWLMVPDDMRLEIRNLVWEGIKSYGPTSQLTGVLQRSIVEIAKVEYPTLWPTFIQDLVRDALSAHGGMVVVMNIIALFSDDIDTFAAGTMTSGKIKEIGATLKDEMGHIMSAVAAGFGSGHEGAILATMKAFRSLVRWIDPKFLFEGSILKDLCTAFLMNLTYTQNVIMILGEVISMAFIPEDYYQFLPQMFTQIIDSMRGVMVDRDMGDLSEAEGSLFTETLPRFLDIYGELVETVAYQPYITQVVSWTLAIGAECEESQLKEVVDFWNGLMQRVVCDIQDPESIVVVLYQPFVADIRNVLTRRMVSPIDIQSLEGDDGVMQRELRMCLQWDDLHKKMRDILVYIVEIDKSGTLDCLNAMARQMASAETMNAFVWSMSAVVGSLNEFTERTYVSQIIANLVNLCNTTTNPQDKVQIAMNTCFLCGQAHSFMVDNVELFTNVVDWMFSLSTASDPDVQEVAIDCLKLFSSKSASDMVKRTRPDVPSIIERILGDIAGHVGRLPPNAAKALVDITGHLIYTVNSEEVKQQMFGVLIGYLDAQLKGIIASFDGTNYGMCRHLIFILDCHRRVSANLGGHYIRYLLDIVDPLLALYEQAISVVAGVILSPPAPDKPRPNMVFVRNVANAIIYLIDGAIYHTFEADIVKERLLAPCLIRVVEGFATAPPDARCPKVLCLIGSLVTKCPAEVQGHAESVFMKLYHPVLDMIKGNFSDYGAFRPEFFSFMESLVISTPDLIISLPPSEFGTFIESIKWGAQHPQTDVCEKCTALLSTFVNNVTKRLSPEQLIGFIDTHCLTLFIFAFELLTDTSLKFAFANHVRFIRVMVSVPEVSRLSTGIMERMINAFPSREPKQLYDFVQSLFGTVLDERHFTSICQDFLISVRDILPHDPVFVAEQREFVLNELRRARFELAEPVPPKPTQ